MSWDAVDAERWVLREEVEEIAKELLKHGVGFVFVTLCWLCC